MCESDLDSCCYVRLRPSSDRQFSKAILWQKDKAILQYFYKAIFFCYNIAVAFQNQLNNHELRFSVHTMKILLEKCLFVFLSQYCLWKSLIWREPYCAIQIQVALVIRCFGIRGFDYSRKKKTANYEGKLLILAKLGLKWQFWYSQFEFFHEPNE